jgi:rubredoxin
MLVRFAGIDCGYIYPDGDFKKAPGSYRCPVCNSPKSRSVGNSSAVVAVHTLAILIAK